VLRIEVGGGGGGAESKVIARWPASVLPMVQELASPPPSFVCEPHKSGPPCVHPLTDVAPRRALPKRGLIHANRKRRELVGASKLCVTQVDGQISEKL